jgi:hypothetical protein
MPSLVTGSLGGGHQGPPEEANDVREMVATKWYFDALRRVAIHEAKGEIGICEQNELAGPPRD